MNIKKKEPFNLSKSIKDYFHIQAFEKIIPWAKKNINFSNDVSAQKNFLDFDAFPYQIDPILTWEDLERRKEVVICSPEQMGVWSPVF